jgi:shikimate dehydrogenase
MSPAVHNWGFARLGLAKVYMAFPTPPERLADVVAAVRALPVAGLSVTIPHKEGVGALVDRVTARAATVGAVNTLYWDGKTLVGENTDVAGFLLGLGVGSGASASAGGASAVVPDSALVLGAGGVARAALAGLREAGVARVAVCNRSAARAVALAEEFGVRAVAWEARYAEDADLLVNATPLGMRGKAEEATPWDAARFRPGRTAYDLVYNPLETRFLREARAAGCAVVDGLTMFVGQAREQFWLWTGCELPETEARAVVLAAMGA